MISSASKQLVSQSCPLTILDDNEASREEISTGVSSKDTRFLRLLLLRLRLPLLLLLRLLLLLSLVFCSFWGVSVWWWTITASTEDEEALLQLHCCKEFEFAGHRSKLEGPRSFALGWGLFCRERFLFSPPLRWGCCCSEAPLVTTAAETAGDEEDFRLWLLWLWRLFSLSTESRGELELEYWRSLLRRSFKLFWSAL